MARSMPTVRGHGVLVVQVGGRRQFVRWRENHEAQRMWRYDVNELVCSSPRIATVENTSTVE